MSTLQPFLHFQKLIYNRGTIGLTPPVLPDLTLILHPDIMNLILISKARLAVHIFSRILPFAFCPFLPKSHSNPISRTHDNLRSQQLLPILKPTLQSRKVLKNPHNGITHLREGKVLADADARPTIEGDIRPAFWSPVVPSLRVEFVDGGEFRRWRWV